MDSNTPCKYDWDNLDVGQFDVNHSEKFFKFRHVKHEKDDVPIKKELYNFSNEKENECNTLNCLNLNQNNNSKVLQQVPSTKNDNADNILKENITEQIKLEEKPQQKKLPNILVKPREKVQQQQQIYKQNNENKIPRAYTYNEFYEKRKQEMIKRLEEEEKKQRIFHSKPAPKFHANYERKIQKKEIHTEKFTEPVTPMVLKKSKEMEEIRKKKIEEYKKKMKPQLFTGREPHVLHTEPYKPKKYDHAIDLMPFNLHMEKRLEERKAFDEKIKEKFEEKKKQVFEEEEEKIRKEKEAVKEIRKMTTFKARPNPFK